MSKVAEHPKAPVDHTSGAAAKPKLLDEVRARIRRLNYSIRTEDTYVDWVRRFVLFHGKRHPRALGAAEIEAFLTHLAVAGKVSASTQNQAKSALLFLYREVLGIDLPWLTDVASARQGKRLPVVLTVAEVQGGTRAGEWHKRGDVAVAVRQRAAADGVRAAAGEGCRFRPDADSGARWQG